MLNRLAHDPGKGNPLSLYVVPFVRFIHLFIYCVL
jgi:hypothetical protein